MNKVPKFLLVTFLNLSFVALLALLIKKTLGQSHFSALLAYVPRPLFLALTVTLFYTKSLAKVPSFLGLHRNILRPWLLGTILTIPNAILILLFLDWKRLALAFDPIEAAWHLGNLMIGYALPQVLGQLAHCLAASLLWGYLTWKLNGNIWACVAYHTLNNFYSAAFIADEHIRQQRLVRPAQSVGAGHFVRRRLASSPGESKA